MTSNDFGVNDPNLLQLLSGINDPQGIAALVNAGPSGRIRIPAMQARNDATTQKYLEAISGNNLTRAGLARQKMEAEAAAKKMEHAAALMGHAPNLVGKGVDLNQLTPYMPWLRKGNTLGANAQTQTNATEAYTENQLAEGVNRHITGGFIPDLGKGPKAPRFYNPAGTPENIGRGITANANLGTTKEMFNSQGIRTGFERTTKGDITDSNLPPPGQIQEGGVNPDIAQQVRKKFPNAAPKDLKIVQQGTNVIVTGVVQLPSGEKKRTTIAVPLAPNNQLDWNKYQEVK